MQIPFEIVNLVNLDHPGVSVSGGIPLACGAVASPPKAFRVTDADGLDVAAQVKVTGWWPDGSVKWVLVTMTAPVAASGRRRYVLRADETRDTTPLPRIRVSEDDEEIRVDTGQIAFRIGKRAPNLFREITGSGAAAHVRYLAGAADAGLFVEVLRGDTPATACERMRFEANAATGREGADRFEACLEEHGPERAVIRLQGVHAAAGGAVYGNYTVRIYAHAGSALLRLVHSLVFTGDPQRDFVASVGLRFRAGLRTLEAHAFGAERGQVRTRHETGDERPVWRRAALIQDGDRHYTIRKWTDPERSRPVVMQTGGRSQGWACMDFAEGHVSLGIRNFWQEHPKAIALDAERGELEACFHSPCGEPLDLRRYSDRVYGSLYETSSKNMPWADPECAARHIAKTSELFLDFTSSPDETFPARQALFFQDPPRLTPGGVWIASTRAFGDFATEATASIVHPAAARRVREIADFLADEQEYRRWYGFLDHGDIVHSFDPGRDCWRLDEGGYAWLNNEFMMAEALWQTYLFTDDPRYFRLAEAMTRHVGDVDMYHQGPLAGHGSRHNVNHWGCMDKERRMTIPRHKRMHYFLTGDERSRDLARLVHDTLCREPPVKEAMDLGVGGYALLLLWETTGDARYGERLRQMVETYCGLRICGKAFPYWLKFDFATGAGGWENDTPHPAWFLLMFGPMHILLEYAELTGDATVRRAILEWSVLLHLPSDAAHAIQPHTPSGPERTGFEMALRVAAFAYRATGDVRFRDYLQDVLDRPQGHWEMRGGDSPLAAAPHRVFITPERKTHQTGAPMAAVLDGYPCALAAIAAPDGA